MNKDAFVQKVKLLCLVKGIKPTNACKECGIGGSFLSDVERGRVPSVDKFEKLAQYLGTTVGDLLGETGPKNLAIQDQPCLVMRYNSLPPKVQEEVMAFIEFKVAQQAEKINVSKSDTEN